MYEFSFRCDSFCIAILHAVDSRKDLTGAASGAAARGRRFLICYNRCLTYYKH